MNREDLRRIADEIGFGFYSGHIEIFCDETPRPYDPAADAVVCYNSEEPSRWRAPATTALRPRPLS
jgi:restriction endonuclease Mrr